MIDEVCSKSIYSRWEKKGIDERHFPIKAGGKLCSSGNLVTCLRVNLLIIDDDDDDNDDDDDDGFRDDNDDDNDNDNDNSVLSGGISCWSLAMTMMLMYEQ